MIFSTSQSIPASLFNKENVALTSSPTVLRSTNGRRLRSRPNNALSPSVIAREAVRDPARRRMQPTARIAPIHPLKPCAHVTDIEMAEEGTHLGSNSPQRSIQLPRHLPRPTFAAVSPAALEAVDPELKEVPLEYIHHTLRGVGQQMLSVAASTTANPPRDRLPRELEVVINDLSADAPTHLLAVYSKAALQVAIHPTHALVLAAHCANLPSLPHSNNTAPSAPGSALTLPVVPLCLPNPTTFPILLHYLYTKRVDHLLASLLPMAPRDATQSIEQLAQSFAETFTVQALLAHVARAHGLWSNVTALGVFDEKLSRGIEMAWEVLLGALAINTGSNRRRGENPTAAMP